VVTNWKMGRVPCIGETLLKEQETIYEGNEYVQCEALGPARCPLKDMLNRRDQR
jgi:hypothetical protein